MGLTIFLAQLLGVYLVVMGIIIFLKQKKLKTIVDSFNKDSSFILFGGAFNLIAGISMVLSHNNWSGGAMVLIVTVFGWLILIKGVLLLVLNPKEYISMVQFFMKPCVLNFLLLIYLIVGLYLINASFGLF